MGPNSGERMSSREILGHVTLNFEYKYISFKERISNTYKKDIHGKAHI